MQKYRFVILVTSILFFSIQASFAQCPQFFDFQGVLQNNPQWVSCSGSNYSLNVISDVNIGNYSIDWGDGTAITNGTSLLANTAVSHNYAAAVSNYNVVITLPDVPCVVSGQVIMEEPSNASIQIPFGGLTSGNGHSGYL